MKDDKACAHLHYSICKALGVETKTNGIHTPTHTHKPVYEQENITVLWNQAVHTDRQFITNRPDIIIKNKKEKTCVLIEVAISEDRNVVLREAENKQKYKSCCIEAQRMWNVKCMIIQVITGATEMQ